MGILQKLLEIHPDNRKWWQVIVWWETRRLFYNLILLFVGIVSMLFVYISIPLVYSMIALILNVLYTFGWIGELLIVKPTFPESTQKTYPQRFFVIYLIFSILIILGFQINLLI